MTSVIVPCKLSLNWLMEYQTGCGGLYNDYLKATDTLNKTQCSKTVGQASNDTLSNEQNLRKVGERVAAISVVYLMVTTLLDISPIENLNAAEPWVAALELPWAALELLWTALVLDVEPLMSGARTAEAPYPVVACPVVVCPVVACPVVAWVGRFDEAFAVVFAWQESSCRTCLCWSRLE